MTMWPFKRRERPDPPGVIAAQAAQLRAEQQARLVKARTGEVNMVVSDLRRRRLANNFGDALVEAMGRRTDA